MPVSLTNINTAHCRSNSAILAWAAKVTPGSPSSPVDLEGTNTHTIELTDLGYSSVFVHFPVTPSTPSPFKPKSPPPVPVSTHSRPNLKHFRSLTALRLKSTPSTIPAMPSMPSTMTKPTHKTTKSKSKAPPLPAPLATELALMQFTGGGKLESHAQRVMAAQAHAAGPNVGVNTVFRDAQGGMWWDEEEKWEYARLIHSPEKENEWVRFEGERRGSVSTQNSGSGQDEDMMMNGGNVVQPADPEQNFCVPPSSRSRARSKSVSATPIHGRRRPAPLNFTHGSGNAKYDFLAASFSPPPLPLPVTPVTPMPMQNQSRSRRGSVVSVKPVGKFKNLFRRRE